MRRPKHRVLVEHRLLGQGRFGRAERPGTTKKVQKKEAQKQKEEKAVYSQSPAVSAVPTSRNSMAGKVCDKSSNRKLAILWWAPGRSQKKVLPRVHQRMTSDTSKLGFLAFHDLKTSKSNPVFPDLEALTSEITNIGQCWPAAAPGPCGTPAQPRAQLRTHPIQHV